MSSSLPCLINSPKATLPILFASVLISSLVKTVSIASPPRILCIASLPNCLPTCLIAFVMATLPAPAKTPIIICLY